MYDMSFNTWVNGIPPVKKQRAKLTALRMKKPFTLGELAKQSNVSYSTALRAMADMPGWLYSYNVRRTHRRGWRFYPLAWDIGDVQEWLNARCKNGRSRTRVYRDGKCIRQGSK